MWNVWMVINDMGDERKIESGISARRADRIVHEMFELGEDVRKEFVPKVVVQNLVDVRCVDCGNKWTSNKIAASLNEEIRCLECGSKKFCKR